MAIKSSIERLAAQLGVESGSRKIGRTTLMRLTLYYLVVIVVISTFILLTGEMKSIEGELVVGSTGISVSPQAEEIAQLTRGMWDPLFQALPPLAYGAAAVIGAFLLALPVAFVYVRTRNSLKYDQSLVQTVIMLPVVVTAILIVVKNSLALAFSLAGIVAAVRFRNNLKDSRDAVYIFAAVGIGFAAGVGQLAIATFLSLFFAVLELLLWKLDLAADHERTFGMLCLPGPLVPGGQVGTLVMSGEASSTMPSADTTLLALGGGEPAPGELAPNGGKQKKPSVRLRLYVTDPDKARPLAEAVLQEMTKDFKLKRTKASGNEQYVMDYQLRARKKSPVAAIIDRMYIDMAPHVIAAEALDQEN